MKFVFQDIHKDPKHLQLWKIYMKFSHNCYMLRYQYKMLQCFCSFTQHFILVTIFAFTDIYPQPVFALHLLIPVPTYASHCINLIVVCTFAFASQPFILPFLAFSILHCSMVFAVIRSLIPSHLCTLYLAFVSCHFEL